MCIPVLPWLIYFLSKSTSFLPNFNQSPPLKCACFLYSDSFSSSVADLDERPELPATSLPQPSNPYLTLYLDWNRGPHEAPSYG